MRRQLSVCVAALFFLAACGAPGPSTEDYESVQPTTAVILPLPTEDKVPDTTVAHGAYLVQIMGCGTCHTDGALVGEPNLDRRLAGSSVGIAYTDPAKNSNPGIVFPPNLTPDEATGIGGLSEAAVIAMIREGANRHGEPQLEVMPWPAYQILSDPDVQAIAAYLRSLPPVSHKVPTRVREGQPSEQDYVHFAAFRSRR